MSRKTQQTKHWMTFVETWLMPQKCGSPQRSYSRATSTRWTRSTSAETAGKCSHQPEASPGNWLPQSSIAAFIYMYMLTLSLLWPCR